MTLPDFRCRDCPYRRNWAMWLISRTQKEGQRPRGGRHGWTQRQLLFHLTITCEFVKVKTLWRPKTWLFLSPPLCCLLTSMCHFRADLFEDEEIKGLLKFRPWWAKLSPSTEQEGEAGQFKLFLHNLFLYISFNLNYVARINLKQ